MTDKSAMRQAREMRGMSRKQVAEAIGTTEHHYWHCEMPPFDGPAEVMMAAQAYLGLGDSPTTSSSGPGEPVERLWRCSSCHKEERQYGNEVWHRCKPGAKLIRLNLVVE